MVEFANVKAAPGGGTRTVAVLGLVISSFVTVALLAQYYTLARILLLGFIIIVSGRTALQLLLGPTEGEGGAAWRQAGRGYVGVAFGGTVVLAVTTLLLAAHAYSFASAVTALIVVICVGCFKPNVREAVFKPESWANSFAFGCAGYVLLAAMLFSPEHYPYLKASAVYLTQGFDLFLSKDPSEWPYFGERFIMPMLYVTHAIGAIFALFSHGDEFEYFAEGQYWLNILLTPLVPVGAYLFFRRFWPWWSAIVAALGFCWIVLGFRLWSIRGETLGWVFGFAFLLTFEALLAELRTRGVTRFCLRATAVLALLYVTLALSHGVAAVVVTFIAAGLTGHFLFTRGKARKWAPLLKIGAAFGASVGLLFLAYAASFSSELNVGKLIFNYQQAPAAGEPDSALLIENALSYPQKYEVPPVRAAPPYLPASTALQITAFLPLADIFRPGFARVELGHFPSEALDKLAEVSLFERAGYVLVLLGCCGLYLVRRSRRNIGAPLFWAATATYVLIAAFSVYLDYSSVSTYPLAASRRTYVYVTFFYCLAIGAAALDFLVLPYVALIARRYPFLANWRSRKEQKFEAAAFFVPLAFTLLYSLAHVSGDNLTPSWMFEKIAERVAGVAIVDSSRATDAASAAKGSADAHLYDAIRFIRNHAAAGDWVFSNVISDNQFWYLSAGRYSLLEGSAMYQVYDLQKRAADRIQDFARFAQTSHSSVVDGYGIRYALLYKFCECETMGCYGYNVLPARVRVFMKNPDFSKVFENPEFVIFRRENPVGDPGPIRPTEVTDLPPDCYAGGPPYAATLADGIQFARPGYPGFIAGIRGLGRLEPWGRWSVDDEVALRFWDPLPEHFMLTLKVEAFGPNAEKPVIVTAGTVERQFSVYRNGEVIRLDFDMPEPTSTITFKIPVPTSPRQFDPNRWTDERRLGIGFIELKIEDDAKGP